jgi:pimeloyl-ACP methyl ester carboxylesterase
MELEVISREPSANPRPTPILFVHGAWQGAWSWMDYFLPYFVEAGYSAHALSFRGHGASSGRERLRWWRIADYVNDLAQVARQLTRPPIVIGHSMGGLVTQKYLEEHTAPAAVLMASVPVHGALKAALRTAGRIPGPFVRANLTLSLYPLVGTPSTARETLFSADMPPEMLNKHFRRLQDESYLGFLDMVAFDLPKPRKVKTPVLVLGAAADAIFTPEEVEATARAYNTRANIFPKMAHEMMLESGWQAVAERILAWLREQAL